MSRFIPLQYIGSEEVINSICLSTIETLKRDYKIKINQEIVVPAIVDCYLDAAIYESLQVKKTDIKSELNLFNLLRVVHEIVPTEDEIISILTLGRMGMRKLEMEFDEENELDEKIETKIADIDIKLLEKISMRASQYLEDRHNLAIRDYQLIFKIAEVFIDEVISYIRINDILDDTITVFDQFTIILDEDGKYDSIEFTESAKSTIHVIFEEVMAGLERLALEDEEG